MPNVILKDYRKLAGGTRESYVKYSQLLPNLINESMPSCDANEIIIYNLEHEKHDHHVGTQSRVLIFANATYINGNEDVILETPQTINGIENHFTNFLPPRSREGDIPIVSEHGVILAEYCKQDNQLNILFDVFSTDSDVNINIFKFIMKEFERIIWLPKTFEHSWIYTMDKQKLTKTLTEKMKQQKLRLIEVDKNQIVTWENKLNSYRREMKQIHDNLIAKRRFVEMEEKNVENISTGLIKDLDLIVKNKKVKDLHVKDNVFTVFTHPLYIYSDKGKRYYGGSYRIEIKPEIADVHFFGDNPRQGYWTSKDPHPHVNGNNGNACFGNVGATIAELCSQMQLYALVMICIDFLESANTSDSAGKNVINWDEVDEHGNIIKNDSKYYCEDEEEEYEYTCERCGLNCPELVTVYEDVEYDDDDNPYPTGEHQVCTICRENDYHYNIDVEEYIRD